MPGDKPARQPVKFLVISINSEIAQGAQAWQKEIGAAAHRDELRQAGNASSQPAIARLMRRLLQYLRRMRILITLRIIMPEETESVPTMSTCSLSRTMRRRGSQSL